MNLDLGKFGFVDLQHSFLKYSLQNAIFLFRSKQNMSNSKTEAPICIYFTFSVITTIYIKQFSESI